jgi:hypothetical protein
MSTNLRVCVVAAGLMGADHIERLTRRIAGAEVSAVVDADASRAKKAVEAIPTAVALSNVGQALDREDVNAVLIATPGFLHRDMLLQVRERDLPILCEKPLTKTDLARRAVRRLPAVIPRHRRDAYDTLRSASASRTSPSPWYHRRLACVPDSRQRRR